MILKAKPSSKKTQMEFPPNLCHTSIKEGIWATLAFPSTVKYFMGKSCSVIVTTILSFCCAHYSCCFLICVLSKVLGFRLHLGNLHGASLLWHRQPSMFNCVWPQRNPVHCDICFSYGQMVPSTLKAQSERATCIYCACSQSTTNTFWQL